jgi:hypothetical protein
MIRLRGPDFPPAIIDAVMMQRTKDRTGLSQKVTCVFGQKISRFLNALS